MSASNKTVDDILVVLLQHLEPAKVREVVLALAAVKGNKSFEETVNRLVSLVTAKEWPWPYLDLNLIPDRREPTCQNQSSD